MIGPLLFVAATFLGGDLPAPPPAPVITATTTTTTTAILPAASRDGVPIKPNPPVVVEVDGGYLMTTGRREVDAMAALPPETDEEYHARIMGRVCEIRPWTCPEGGL